MQFTLDIIIKRDDNKPIIRQNPLFRNQGTSKRIAHVSLYRLSILTSFVPNNWQLMLGLYQSHHACSIHDD